MQFITVAALLLATGSVNAACPPGYRQHRHSPSTKPVASSSAPYSFPTYPAATPTPTPSSTPVAVVPSSSSTPAAATPVPTTSDSSLTADEQSALDTQNDARSEVGVDALTWSDALAADAQTWADHLAAQNSPGSLVHDTDSGEGENLYWQSGGSDPYAAAAEAWVAEKSLYNGEAITGSGNFEEYGHYSMWTYHFSLFS